MLRLRLESFFAFLALCSDGSYRCPNSWRHECGTVNRSSLNEEYLLLEPSSRNRKQVGHESFWRCGDPDGRSVNPDQCHCRTSARRSGTVGISIGPTPGVCR